jgi:hypothetical protein
MSDDIVLDEPEDTQTPKPAAPKPAVPVWAFILTLLTFVCLLTAVTVGILEIQYYG